MESKTCKRRPKYANGDQNMQTESTIFKTEIDYL